MPCGDARRFRRDAWSRLPAMRLDGFAARCRLRSGLTCLGDASHSARSSSLRPRLRRGGAGNSEHRARRPALHRRGSGEVTMVRLSDTGATCGRASGSGTGLGRRAPAQPPVVCRWRRGRPCGGCRRGRRSQRASSPSAASSAETASRSSPTAARPAAASCGRARRIEALRHQHHEARIVSQPAGDLAGLGTGAEIEIGARRTDDRRAGVLRDHQPVERRLRLSRIRSAARPR